MTIFKKFLLIVILVLLASCFRGVADTAPADLVDLQELAHQIVTDYREQHADWDKPHLVENMATLNKGVVNFPNDPQVNFALALCYIQQDDKQNYLKYMEKAYTLSKNDVAIGTLYAFALKMNKQPLKAMEVYKDLLALHPTNFTIKFSMAMLELLIQRYDEALAIFEPINQQFPSSLGEKDRSMLLFVLGSCYLYKGEDAKAINAFQKALVTIPTMVMALTSLGETYVKTGDMQNAGAVLDKALAINPTYPQALYYKGIVLEKAGNVQAAQDSFQKAYAISKAHLDKYSQNGEDYYLMFLICQKLNKPEEGVPYKAEAAQLLFTYEAPWKVK